MRRTGRRCILNGTKSHGMEVKWEKEEHNYIHIYVCMVCIFAYFPLCALCMCVWLLKFYEGTSQIDLYSKAMKRLTFGRHFKAIVCFMIFSFAAVFYRGEWGKPKKDIYEKKKKAFETVQMFRPRNSNKSLRLSVCDVCIHIVFFYHSSILSLSLTQSNIRNKINRKKILCVCCISLSPRV